jgi:hypothetical protein
MRMGVVDVRLCWCVHALERPEVILWGQDTKAPHTPTARRHDGQREGLVMSAVNLAGL